MKKLIFWAIALFLFVYSAGFQCWIFWQLYLHQEILIYDLNPLINKLEFGLASAILIIALIALGWFIGAIRKG